MKTIFYTILILTLFSLLICSCSKEDSNQLMDSDCITKAFYRGTHVCYTGEYAAGLEFESDGSFIILSNFFEMVDSSSIEFSDTIYMDFENIDSTIFNSGVLCGALIVAPVAELTCVEY